STIDRYMISKCFEAVESIQTSMNSYNSQEACKILMNFFEVLNNWYIRRSRERFWKSDLDQDKTDAYNVLYTVFYYILRAAAPLLPLITENIWQGLKYEETSVHLADFPQLEKFDSQLIAKMDLVREICNSALSIRNTFNIRIRQPLNSMTIYHKSSCGFLEDEPLSVISEFSPVIQVADTGIQCAADSNEYQEMIKDEVNVKSLELVNRLEGIASLELKLNFPLLGKRIPDKIKKLVQYVKEGKWKQVENEQIFLGDESENYIIEKGEYELLLKANSEYSSVFDNNKGIVILNTELNDELILEGLARDAVRLIQETRKQADFHVSNRIRVIIKTEDEKIKEAINTWSEYIKEQTLALSLEVNIEIGINFYSKEYQDSIVGIKLDC
ncbi:MAG: class I tRNA ligase family protein, partial [Wolbachia sp.]